VKGSLLDVGCGSGKYLELARREGWRAVGIEPSEQAASVVAERGFEVIVGDALSVDFPPERFDRVRCAHVLEHVTDPVLLLTRMRDAVKPGGALEILVPNPGSLWSRVFRNYWHGLELPRHLYHYRVEDIRALARCTGMEVTRVHYSSSPSALLWSLDRLLAGRRGGSRWLRDNRRLRKLAHPLTWLIARMRLADVVEYRLESTRA
jgi:SAM-dependent methyltransferase